MCALVEAERGWLELVSFLVMSYEGLLTNAETSGLCGLKWMFLRAQTLEGGGSPNSPFGQILWVALGYHGGKTRIRFVLC